MSNTLIQFQDFVHEWVKMFEKKKFIIKLIDASIYHLDPVKQCRLVVSRTWINYQFLVGSPLTGIVLCIRYNVDLLHICFFLTKLFEFEETCCIVSCCLGNLLNGFIIAF